MQANKLYYLVGASGAGKDTLLHALREQLSDSIIFVNRYITREVQTGGEKHIALTETEFLFREQCSLFALHWQAHGFYYGIGQEVQTWLQQGLNVIVNGSRAALPHAEAVFSPYFFPVLVDVNLENLEARLKKRQRESDEEIAARLQRAHIFSQSISADVTRLDNNESIDVAVHQFLKLHETHRTKKYTLL